MRTVHVTYRREGTGWTADVVELPRYTAFAESFEEIVQLVREGVPFALDVKQVDLAEGVDMGSEWSPTWNGAAAIMSQKIAAIGGVAVMATNSGEHIVAGAGPRVIKGAGTDLFAGSR